MSTPFGAALFKRISRRAAWYSFHYSFMSSNFVNKRTRIASMEFIEGDQVENDQQVCSTDRIDVEMGQEERLPRTHPSYGLMHMAGQLEDHKNVCAAAHAIVSAIDIATSQEEQQAFALQLMRLLKTTLSMEYVHINVLDTSKPRALCSNCGKRPVAAATHCFADWCTRCDDALWATRDDEDDRDSVSYLAAYSAKDSADNHSAGNDNGIPPLVSSDNGDGTSDAIQDSVD
jgi:hypothetical protein